MASTIETNNRILQSSDSLRQSATAGKGDKLEKSDFMNLFMYQLSNQNPLDPMDSEKMMSSLSQLGSMEQLQALNSKFGEIASSQKQLVQFSALNFINRKVQIKADLFKHEAGTPQMFNLELAGSASNVKAQIINGQNQIIKEVELGQKTAGGYSFTWDGTDRMQNQVASGDYSARVNAYNEQGQNVAADLTRQAIVSQIRMDADEPLIKVDGSYIPISQAVLID